MTRFLMLTVLFAVLPFSGGVTAKSLYDETQYKAIAEDQKANKIGDSLTVIILENSSATASTDNNANKNFDVSADFGKTNRTEVGSVNIGMGSAAGAGTGRQGSLRAQISATITQKDDNGRLKLEGRQTIVVNGEEQIISLSGWIREKDVSAENVIVSNRLSDAKIEYTGYGDLEETKKPGFFKWLFRKVGLI